MTPAFASVTGGALCPQPEVAHEDAARMQGSLWVDLFRRIPPAKHNTLVVVTAGGIEYMVQRIFRLEEDFVILRARLAGSSDQGRVVLLPYDQLSSVAFNGVLQEAEVETMFGDGEAMIAAPDGRVQTPTVTEDKPAEPAREAGPAAVAETRPLTPSAPPDSTPSGASPPKISKSLLLARLRARLSGQPASRD